MASIIEITNPLTGAVEQVDKLDHTAQEIDDGINATGIESTDHPGCYYRMVGDVVEWVNPPMQLGVEYRTTERYQGKPVYVKSIDLGDLPSNSTNEVPIGVDNIENVISVFGTSSNGFAFPVPLHGSDGSIDVIVSRTSIKVITYATQVISSVAIIKYTKTTD